MIFQLLTHIITLKVTGGARGGYPKEDSIILQGLYLGEVARVGLLSSSEEARDWLLQPL